MLSCSGKPKPGIIIYIDSQKSHVTSHAENASSRHKPVLEYIHALRSRGIARDFLPLRGIFEDRVLFVLVDVRNLKLLPVDLLATFCIPEDVCQCVDYAQFIFGAKRKF